MIPSIHFATFLKLIAQNTQDRIKSISKYDEPGGFDFWGPMRSAVSRYAVEGISQETALNEIERNSGAGNQQYCSTAFETVATWVNNQGGSKHSVSHGIWTSPLETFRVKIEPEFQVISSRANKTVAVYPNKAPLMTRDVAGAGIIFMREHYGIGYNGDFSVYDVQNRRCHSAMGNVSEQLLRASITDIDSHFERLVSR